MRFSSRKWVLGIVAGAMAILIPAGLAWSCVALVAFRVNGSGVVQPGGTVEVFGGEFASGQPIDIHLDSPDGPVLFTQPPPTGTMTSQFTVQVPIPADISPGPHLLVATQNHYNMNVGNSAARAVFHVNSSPPVEPTPQDRATTLVVEDESSAAGYILIGLGVAAAGLLLAAAASMIVARRPSSPGRAEGVKSS